MIQMIAGVFGLPVDGIVRAMDKNCGPFEASPEQEARLIRLGLAVRVDEIDMDMPIGFDETPPENYTEDDGEPELPDDVVGIPEYSTKNTKAELNLIALQCGITLDASMSKAEMVAALDAHIEANMVDGVDVEDEADAEDDSEPAPAFDASEAVL